MVNIHQTIIIIINILYSTGNNKRKEYKINQVYTIAIYDEHTSPSLSSINIRIKYFYLSAGDLHLVNDWGYHWDVK